MILAIGFFNMHDVVGCEVHKKINKKKTAWLWISYDQVKWFGVHFRWRSKYTRVRLSEGTNFRKFRQRMGSIFAWNCFIGDAKTNFGHFTSFSESQLIDERFTKKLNQDFHNNNLVFDHFHKKTNDTYETRLRSFFLQFQSVAMTFFVRLS